MIFQIVEDFEKNPSQFEVLSADDAEQMVHGKGGKLKSFATYPQADAFVASLLEHERRIFYDKLLKREKKGEKKSYKEETIQIL